MKIAVIKIGARITWETDAAVGPGEAISICKALSAGGAEVHVFTKILKKDTLDSSLNWHNLPEDLNTDGLDALVIVNGNVNYFGGQDDPAQTTNYHIINNFKGKVVYIMCDPFLPLKQAWPVVNGKPWGVAYKESDINITRTDIIVFSQPAQLEVMAQKWDAQKGVQIDSMLHFPMEHFPLMNEWLAPNPEPTIDLMYGGTTRGGRRIPNLYKWYWNHPSELKVEVFGKIDADDFTGHAKLKSIDWSTQIQPAFTGMVKYSEVLPKMQTSMAHLVCGDPDYEVIDIIPQRVAECHAAGNVVFVDQAMDKARRIYTDPLLREYLYVATREELSEKLLHLKTEPLFRSELIDMARIDQDWNELEFCQSLVKQIEAA